MRKTAHQTLAAGALAALLALTGCAGAPADDNRREMVFAQGRQLTSAAFTGAAFRNDLIETEPVFNFAKTNSITFEPGAHSSWHRHGAMVVIATGGKGHYQEEGKDALLLRKGDVVQIPAGTRHWHGAAKDSWFSQLVIYDAAWKPKAAAPAGEDNRVTDAYYNALKPVEAPRKALPSDGLMFPAGDKFLSLPTFTGPVRVSTVLEKGNVAGVPNIHYVVFEPGVINAWHSHKGGQILVVTDGIGYHQVEGKPVEVLRPGDVAKCPPGVRHWHGAAPESRFAHLAVNTNPDRPGVEWFKPISPEEYARLPKE